MRGPPLGGRLRCRFVAQSPAHRFGQIIGDEIRSEFQSKREALAFLKTIVESSSRELRP